MIFSSTKRSLYGSVMIKLEKYEAFLAAQKCGNPLCVALAWESEAKADASILLGQLQSLNKTHESLKSKLGALIVFTKMMELF